MVGDAVISPCEKYRYKLTRKWADGPEVLFVMLNPSTADASQDDPTIKRCISFAKDWGFGSLAVANLFAYRTPSPDQLISSEEPIGAENDRWLHGTSVGADLTIAAWGNHGQFRGRGREVAATLIRPHYLRLTKLGEPSHPLYLRKDSQPVPWEVAR